MNRPLKIALRLFVIAALVVSVHVLSGPASSGNSPYLSALSDLTGGVCTLTAC